MSIVGPDAEQAHAVVIYHSNTSGDVAKSFATHMRAKNDVKVKLIWGSAYRGEENVLGGIAAIVIEEGCPNGEKIEADYRKWSPETEIHFMTSEGQWANVGTEDPDTTGQPEPVQTKTAAEGAATEGSVPVPGEEDAGPDSVSDDAAGGESGDDAAADDAEDSREAT